MDFLDNDIDLINRNASEIIGGTPCIWGRPMGKIGDTRTKILKATAQKFRLVIFFDHGEILNLKSPAGIDISSPFSIADAEIVRFEFFKVAPTRLDQNRRYLEYLKHGHGHTDIEWYQPNLEPDLCKPAFQLLY